MNKTVKRTVSAIICTCMLFGTSQANAIKFSEVCSPNSTIILSAQYGENLLEAYEELCEFLTNNGIPSEISLEEFQNNYEKGEYASVDEYVQTFYDILETSNSQSSTGYTLSRNNWYYNTGTKLTASPKYSTYNLLNVVQAGDIIYEAEGGSGITGHIAIVEGKYYDANYGRYYIRIIESIGYISGSGQADGVCRGVLDDERLDNRGGVILRVSSASSSNISGAISFCTGQIGKSYNLDFVKDSATTESDWYCSELVWAAYKSQGIDLDSGSGNTYVTPAEILASSKVSTISKATIGTPQNATVSVSTASKVTVSWSAVSGATSYDVYYSSSYNGTYYYLGRVTSTSISTNIATGTTEYYRVQAIKGTTGGNLSDPVGCKNEFAAPTIVNCYTPSSTSVALTWTAIQGATSYRIYRSTDKANYTQIATTSSTTYTNTGLTTGTTYYYKVAAVKSSSVSAQSSYKLKRPTKVLTPQIYFGASKEVSGLVVKWTYIPGATSYSVYMADSIYSPEYVLVASTTTTYIDFVPSTTASTYIFKIVANGNGGSSDYSDALYVSV